MALFPCHTSRLLIFERLFCQQAFLGRNISSSLIFLFAWDPRFPGGKKLRNFDKEKVQKNCDFQALENVWREERQHESAGNRGNGPKQA